MSTATHSHAFPKHDNAPWPGVVGRGDGSEPAIPLETLLGLWFARLTGGVRDTLLPRVEGRG